MHRSRWIVVLGAVVALTPLSGLPLAGKSAVEVLSGLSIIGLSVWSQIDKKLSQKAKAQMRAQRKTSFVASEASPASGTLEATQANEARLNDAVGQANQAAEASPGRRITDSYPKTGQSGRRRTDMSNVSSPDLKPSALSEPEPFSSEEEAI